MDLVRDWLDAVKLFSAPMGDVAQGSEISFAASFKMALSKT